MKKRLSIQIPCPFKNLNCLLLFTCKNSFHIYLAVLGRCCCVSSSPAAGYGLLTAMASHGAYGASVVATRGLDSCSSWALEHRLILWHTTLAAPPHGTWRLPRPGIKLCLLHWRMDSTTEPSGKPTRVIYSGY